MPKFLIQAYSNIDLSIKIEATNAQDAPEESADILLDGVLREHDV